MTDMLHIKNVISYLLLTGLAVLYTLFLEAPGGSYLIIALVSAAVISVAVCIYTRYVLTAKIEINTDILNRGDTVKADLILDKTGILPSSFIEAELFSSYHFSAAQPQKLRTAVFGRDKLFFSCGYKAEFFGKGKIGVSTITVTDYLGLISFHVNIPKAIAEIKIYPDIPEVDRREGLARSLTDAAAFDDSEETTQSVFAINGTPGYEHRKYEPGDSLKLINWKISAKRGELFVRRPEGSSGAEQTFILDKACSVNPETLDARREEQLVVEGMLALMMQFAKTELPCSLAVRFGSDWEKFPVVTPTDVSDIRYRLTDFVFSEDAVGRLPASAEGHCAVFTARCDAQIAGFVSGYEDRAAAAPKTEIHSENIWTIVRDEEDIRFEK